MPIQISCEICRKQFTISPSRIKRRKRFCSLVCKNIWLVDWLSNGLDSSHPRWKGGLVESLCRECRKPILIKRHKTLKGAFCSRRCNGSFQMRVRKRTGKILNCLVCEKEFYRVKSAVERKTKKPRYCSQRCRAFDSIKKQRKVDTNIEALLAQWLDDHQIEYEKHKAIDGICLTDFFIKPNICLFADGDYWHSLPKRVEVDKKQTELLCEKGYVVYRLLGKNILNGDRPNALLHS